MGAPPFADEAGDTNTRTIVAQGTLTAPGVSPPFTAASSAMVSLWGVWGASTRVYVDRSDDGGATWPTATAGGALAPFVSDAAIEPGNSFAVDTSKRNGRYRIRVARLAGGVLNYVVAQ